MVEADTCKPSGKLRGKKPPPGQCDSNCCEDGKFYTTYKCSPPVSSHTKGKLTINSFAAGGEGGGPSECDNRYHSDDEPAKVVDECDSAKGCDSEHGYQPPCPNNIVDASKAVWKALGVPENDWGLMDIYWSDAN
ncbi:hypothetical protein Golax_005514 [Gossypium laxum]|uniref:Ripening-related protein 1 n=1 Tax=Gossypium laxum TaxID=34288 RepID=A0A7J9A0Y4_9ROSI|nr:hypothetical protein [Gossypium laxum]